jgi:hypothetical protein
MIWKLLKALLGRKMKNDAVNAVMGKVNLPDPAANAIKAATTGNVSGLVGDLKKTALKNAKKGVRK